MRSSLHQVACAACSGAATSACSRIAATSPTSWVSTQRTTSDIVRPSRAAAKNSGASSLAAVAYQNSPSAVVPSAFAASHRSAPTRQARGQSPHPVRGDHRLGRAAVESVGSIHHTRPRRLHVPSVWCNKSLLTLAATTGPRQPRMAGTASRVVLPLCVGPTTTSDWAGSAATTPARTRPGDTPSTSRPGGTASVPDEQGSQVTQPGPARAASTFGATRTPPVPRGPPGPFRGDRGHERPSERDGHHGRLESTHRPDMAASVSAISRSGALRRCWTRKERCPIFQSAIPRRSWGNSSVSVLESDNSSAAASSSPGDCA